MAVNGGQGSNRNPNAKPPNAAAYAQLRNELADTFGITVGEFNRAIGTAHGGRSWRVIGDLITTWLQSQTK